MKKKKSLLMCSGLVFLAMGSLAGCASSSASLTIWVGSESVEYYRGLAKKFKADNPGFGMNIQVSGADTGSAAGQMTTDNTACADIVTIAHDNVGKLSRLSYIAPIVQGEDAEMQDAAELITQINEDNPDSFLKVIKNILGNGSDGFTYTFAVPYISQALFLYYDTRYITDTEAETFEGLLAAAKRYDQEHGADKTKAVTVTGVDGYNYSFSLLARNLTAGNKSALRLFEGGSDLDCYNQDNDQVAVMKWMQRYYAEKNGILLESDSPWATNIENHVALSVIGGAWHYNSFKKAVTDKDGKIHMGCKAIPTFTLTAEDVAGINSVNYPDDPSLPQELRGMVDEAPAAGTQFRGGSFVDCKCFVINMAAINGDVERYYKICRLLKYFSTKQAQNDSFLEALNVPAYEGADEYIQSVHGQVEETAYLMANAQTGMTPYGIPQPFVSGDLNAFFYSRSAPDYYLQCVKKNQSGDTVDSIREVLYRMEYVWKQGKSPNTKSDQYPASFPANSTTVVK